MLKYQLIANQIEDHIYENDLPKGTKLPTVEQFASDYSVSKSTIVKALETLVLRGIVYQVQGSGIFVRKRNKKGYINFNSPKGFTDSLEEHKITSKLVDLELVKPDDEICNHLECDKDEDVYVVKRVRYIDGEIMCYEESFYKKSIVPFLNQEIVNGSIFDYIKKAFNITTSFQDRYFNVIKLDEKYREKLMKIAETSEGLEKLYNEAKKIDEKAIGKISPNDKKRIIRILEIYNATGKNKIFGINIERPILYDRINKRVDIMIEQGLIEEVKNLIKKYPEFPTAMQAIGYKEIVEYLNNELSLSEAIEKIKQETRRYAKRQITWFKRIENLKWLDGLEKTQNNINIILEVMN